MSERWLPVVGWEGLYEVSDLGRVRSLDRTVEYYHWPSKGVREYKYKGQILKRKYCHKNAYGKWPVVMLGNGDQGRKYPLVSRLVLTAFLRPPQEKEDAAHFDGVPENCALGNLRWATRKENAADTIRHGRCGRPPKLATQAVRAAIREALANGESLTAQARKHGISYALVQWVASSRHDVQEVYK
jgi:hypothetical protein